MSVCSIAAASARRKISSSRASIRIFGSSIKASSQVGSAYEGRFIFRCQAPTLVMIAFQQSRPPVAAGRLPPGRPMSPLGDRAILVAPHRGGPAVADGGLRDNMGFVDLDTEAGALRNIEIAI